MGFNFDTGFGDTDPFTSFGAGGYAGVYADVSNGAPDEQTDTPTGTGTGTFLSTSTQNGIFGLLQTGLNYALLRDQQKMTAIYGPMQGSPQQQQSAALSVQASADKRMFNMLLIGGVIYLLVRK